MNIYSISKKGRRDQNEDAETIYINYNNTDQNCARVNLYGVYDGHGGKFVSRFLSQNLPKYFTDKNTKYPLSGRYVRNTFKELQTKLEKDHGEQADYCGSTCLLTVDYIYEKRRFIDVMNLGDSRCVISKHNKANVITKDHKPHWPDEKQRIEKMGGKIYYDGVDWRIGDLSVSRAFGDIDNKPYISSVPDIYRYKLNKHDQFMIIACDGLWDVMDNQDAVNYVISQSYDLEHNRINKKTNIAKMLADMAIQKGSTDNVTVIIVFF